MATLSKSAFGSKENLETAKSAGKVDAFDVAYLTNGEIAWIAKDGSTKFNTPRTQAEVSVTSVGENVVVPAGSNMDELVDVIANTLMAQLKEETLKEATEYADSVANASGNEVIEF